MQLAQPFLVQHSQMGQWKMLHWQRRSVARYRDMSETVFHESQVKSQRAHKPPTDLRILSSRGAREAGGLCGLGGYLTNEQRCGGGGGCGRANPFATQSYLLPLLRLDTLLRHRVNLGGTGMLRHLKGTLHWVSMPKKKNTSDSNYNKQQS